MQQHLSECAQSHWPIGDQAADQQTHLPTAASGHLPTIAHNVTTDSGDLVHLTRRFWTLVISSALHADAAKLQVASHTVSLAS